MWSWGQQGEGHKRSNLADVYQILKITKISRNLNVFELIISDQNDYVQGFIFACQSYFFSQDYCFQSIAQNKVTLHTNFKLETTTDDRALLPWHNTDLVYPNEIF